MPSCHPAEPLAAAGYTVLFLTGLAISIGHCVGMCGPIQIAFASRQAEGGGRAGFAWARYHAGRILAYALIGGAFALVGAATGFAERAAAWQGGLSLLVGLGMVVLALGLVGLTPTKAFGAPGGGLAVRWVGRLLGTRSAAGQFGLGVANGFLPCGPVVAAALTAAAAAHVATGMLLMTAYGLGTVPALVVLAVASHRAGPAVRRRFYRVGGALILLVGLQLGLRGAAALGWVPHVHLGDVVLW